MKRPYDPHTIRMVEWFGEIPKPGDTLFNSRTSYQVLEIRNLRCEDGVHKFNARCLVLPPHTAPTGEAYRFQSVAKRRLRNRPLAP